MAPEVSFPGRRTYDLAVNPSAEGPALLSLSAEAFPELLVLRATLEVALPTQRLRTVSELLRSDQLPGPSATSPATFSFLVLADPPTEVLGKADVKTTLEIP